MTFARLVAVWVTVVLLSAASPAAEPYRLSVEDVLTVSVYGHDELTREVVVLTDGRFTYPIVGSVSAAGRTAAEVARSIEDGLSSELAAPKVTVSVKTPAARRVYVSGLVPKAGSLEMKPGWRVSHAIAEAGGLTLKPELARATLIRGQNTIPVNLEAILGAGNLDEDCLLEPGDLLQIQADTSLVHVAGQVKNPGDYQVKKRLGVVEAVAMAGGPTPTAALSRAHIVRGGEVLKVNLYDLLVRGQTDGNVEVKPGDTLVIPENEARIAVLGAVQQPGYYEVPDGRPLTVVDAIGLAKGATRTAKLDRVSLVRITTPGGSPNLTKLNVEKFLRSADLSQNPGIQTGDIVYVSDGKERLQPANILSLISSLASPLLYRALD